LFGDKKGMGVDDDATKTDKSIPKYRKNPPKANIAKKDTRLSPGALGGKIKPTVKKDKKVVADKKPNVIKKVVADKKSKTAASASNTKNFASTMAMQKKLIAKGAKIKADGIMGPKTRAAMQKFMKPKTEKKVEKKIDKKASNYVGSRAIPKKTEKEVEKKKSKSFLGRVKEDFDKAVKETKRNFSDKRYFVNGVDSRKEKIKSKSNIKQKK